MWVLGSTGELEEKQSGKITNFWARLHEDRPTEPHGSSMLTAVLGSFCQFNPTQNHLERGKLS